MIIDFLIKLFIGFCLVFLAISLSYASMNYNDPIEEMIYSRKKIKKYKKNEEENP